MRRKPALKLSALAAALMLPGAVAALGLGQLSVQSSLGQPLSARIEITAATPQELESLAVRVADPALYRQNNLAYSSALARTRISLERGASGEPYLRVSTVGPVSDPYLDLMVELNWPAGRLVRGYTFLLDPPGVLPPPVEPVTPVRSGAAPARTAPPAAAQAAPVASAAAPAPAAPAVAGGEQYRVRRGDTLTVIAEDRKPQSVTLDQMLVALFTTNQDAFEASNINRLRAGSILTIPNAETAAATPPQESSRIVRMQASEWRAYRDRIAATAPTADGGGTRAASGKITAAVVETPPVVPPGQDRLQVSRQAGVATTSAAEAEELVARERQIREAQARIAELEKTLSELKRAVELKSQGLAQAQGQAETAKPAAVKPPEPAPIEPAKVAEAPKAPEAPKAAEIPKAAPTPPAAPKAPAAPAPAAPKTFLESLLASTPTWAIGGGALAVLAGLAAILVARRRRAAVFHDSVRAPIDLKTKTVFTSTGGGAVNTGETTTTGEFSRDGFGNIDADEVDPIAEAEVYLAYGRDAQAEEILRHALRRDAQRQEIYLKLLEIHAQHNKPSAFEAVAAELLAVCKGEGEVWQKAMALGRELDPRNPLFAPPGQPLPGGADRGPAGAAAEAGLNARLDDDLASLAGGAARPRVPGAGAAAFATGGADRAAAASVPATEPLAAPAAAAASRIDLARAEAELELGLGRAAARNAVPEPRAPAPETMGAPGRLDVDIAVPAAGPQASSASPSVLDTQWHDAATKLDLAKAYQEMGDIEGARELLREVALEGDAQQAAEAVTLLGKLG